MAQKLKKIQFFGFLTSLLIFTSYCYSIITEEPENTVKNVINKQDDKLSKTILEFQQKYLLKEILNKYAVGYYYLWWRTNEDSRFIKSKNAECLIKTNNEILGVESYVIASIMRTLEVIKNNESKFELPVEENKYDLTFETSAHKIILLTIDKNEGLSFHFRKEDGEENRDNFTRDFYEYVKAIKTMVKNNNKNLDQNPSNCLEVAKVLITGADNNPEEDVDKISLVLQSKSVKRDN
jgi:hypothetical protein